MKNLPTYILCLLIAVVPALPSCTATGPVSSTAVGLAAGGVAVLDQLLADDVLQPDQHAALVGSLNTIAKGVEDAQQPDIGTAAAGAGTAGAAVLGIVLKMLKNRDRRYTPEELEARRLQALKVKAKLA